MSLGNNFIADMRIASRHDARKPHLRQVIVGTVCAVGRHLGLSERRLFPCVVRGEELLPSREALRHRATVAHQCNQAAGEAIGRRAVSKATVRGAYAACSGAEAVLRTDTVERSSRAARSQPYSCQEVWPTQIGGSENIRVSRDGSN
jgi:hypothetical protein